MSDATQKSGSSLLFPIGSVLWVAVFVALFLTRRNQGDTAPNSSTAGDPISETELTSGSDDGEEGGLPKTVEVNLTWPDSGVKEFSFTDHLGETLTKNDLLGKPWVASFIFTKCAGPCPRVTSAVQGLFKKYRDKGIRFVSFTVDPERDTPETLRKYADYYEADPEQWHFLTGDRDDLYGLINGSFLMPAMEAENPEPGFEFIHTTNVCLVDETGRVTGKYNSTNDIELAKLRKDLDAILKARQVRTEAEANE